MKKFILFLLVATITNAFVFAAASDSGVVSNDDNTPTAETIVTLDLTSGGNSYVELWFDSQASTSIPNEPNGPKAEVKLGFESGGLTATNGNDPLYACWNIVSGDAIDVELYLKAPLSDSADGENIGWKATWDGNNDEDGSISSDTIDESTKMSLGVLESYSEATGTTLKKTDSKQINISTNQIDYTKITSGNYTASLYLRCKTV